MAFENDIELSIGAHSEGFEQTLKQSEAELRRFIRGVEKETQRSWETVSNQIRRSVVHIGGDMAGQAAASLRQQERLYWNQQYALAPGMGQGPMVEPGRMASDTAAALTASQTSMRSLVKAGAYVAATVEGIHLVTKLWNEDLEGAGKIITSLPFGVGHLASSLGAILSEWGGINKIAEQTKKVTEEWDTVVANMKIRFKALRRDRAIEASILADERAAALALMPQDQRAFMQLAWGLSERLKGATSEKEREAILKRYNAERLALIRQQTDREDAEYDRRYMQQRADDEHQYRERLRQQERAHDEYLRRERDFTDHLLQDDESRRTVEDELNEARLRAAGKTREAEQAQILATFNARIREAERQKRVELARMLRETRDLEIQIAGRHGMEERQRGLGPMISRFLTGLPGASVGVSNKWDKDQKKLGEIKDEAKKHNTLLERMINVIREQGWGGERIAVYAGN